jgi:methylated-DNA-[protein]-cysteine S-methyltransferase
MRPLITTIHHSPVGPLRLVAGDHGLRGLYFAQHRHAPALDPAWLTDDGAFDDVREQLDAYFDGDLRDFDLPLDPVGTVWQHRVWTALRDVPYGQTWSYGELAAHVGAPRSARAAGLANGRNPLSIIVPCHRVVGADGSLTGYGGGLARKEYLLGLEQRMLAGRVLEPVTAAA